MKHTKLLTENPAEFYEIDLSVNTGRDPNLELIILI